MTTSVSRVRRWAPNHLSHHPLSKTGPRHNDTSHKEERTQSYLLILTWSLGHWVTRSPWDREGLTTLRTSRRTQRVLGGFRSWVDPVNGLGERAPHCPGNLKRRSRKSNVSFLVNRTSTVVYSSTWGVSSSFLSCPFFPTCFTKQNVGPTRDTRLEGNLKGRRREKSLACPTHSGSRTVVYWLSVGGLTRDSQTRNLVGRRTGGHDTWYWQTKR